MTVNSDSFVTKTSLDYSAEGYWQDFLAERRIAGGIAYESQLRACELDESLASLQRVDRLLSQIRRDINNLPPTTCTEEALLADDRFRHLLSFLAFYAGRILANHWQSLPHWYSQTELRRRYPELSLSREDFYQEMAVIYRSHHFSIGTSESPIYQSAKQAIGVSETARPLFFALEPIGLRLFGHIDRQFVAAQGKPVASGLYQAVRERLPSEDSTTQTTINTDVTKELGQTHSQSGDKDYTTSIPHQANTTESVESVFISQLVAKQVDHKPDINQQRRQVEPPDISAKMMVNSSTDKRSSTIATQTVLAKQDRQHTAEADTEANTGINTDTTNLATDTAANKANSEPINHTKVVDNKVQATPEIFTRLLTELTKIDVPQSAGIKEYQQALRMLDQFERHIARQAKPREQVIFSDTHEAARQQALSLLARAANKGNTSAMLQLAMYELLGEGLIEGSILKNAIEPRASDSVSIKTGSLNKSEHLSQDQSTDGRGIRLVQQAANAKDSRAQRLLSKLYYQGVGIEQDMAMGKYWLEQAADNGHPEAIAIDKQWQQAQLLMTTKAQEQHSLKRYQLLIAIVIVVALLLIIFV